MSRELCLTQLRHSSLDSQSSGPALKLSKLSVSNIRLPLNFVKKIQLFDASIIILIDNISKRMILLDRSIKSFKPFKVIRKVKTNFPNKLG